MNALLVLLILAGLIYGVIVDGTFWKIYGIIVTAYLVFVLWQRDPKENPKRKTILASTWSRKYTYMSIVQYLNFVRLFFFDRAF